MGKDGLASLEVKASDGAVKKKRGFWPKFATFLMMGGWILILILVIGAFIAASLIFK